MRSAIWKDAVDGPRMVPHAQRRRRRSGRPARPRRRAPGGLRLPDRVLRLLGARARPRRLHLRAVRRELHRRRPRRRRGLRRRSLPHRRRAVRGHPAARDVLPRRDPDGRPARCRRCWSRTTAPGFYLRVLEEGAVQAGDAIVKVAAGARAADDRRRRRAALPARPVARAARARAAHTRRSARAGRAASASCSRGRRGRRRAARGRVSVAAGRRDPPRERERRSRSGSSGRRRSAPAPPGQYLTVRVRPDADGAAAGPQLLAVGLRRRGYRISVKREGAASRYLHEHCGRRRARRRRRRAAPSSCATGHAPGGPDQRGRRRDPGPGDAARARPRAQPAARVVAARRARSRGARVRRRGRRPARRAARRSPPRRLQPPGAPATRSTTSPADWTPQRWTGRTSRRRRPLRLRAGRLHGRDRRRAERARRRPGTCRRRGLRRRRRARLRHRLRRRPPSAPAGRRARHRPGRHLRAQQPHGPWDDRYPSLLDLAEACDVPVGFGCRTGVCHNCESGLMAGAVTYTTDPLESPPEGRILVCCSHPASELTLDL